MLDRRQTATLAVAGFVILATALGTYWWDVREPTTAVGPIMRDQDVDVAAEVVSQEIEQAEAEKQREATAVEVIAPPMPLSASEEVASPSGESSSPDEPAEPGTESGGEVVTDAPVPSGPVAGLGRIPADEEGRAAEGITRQEALPPPDDVETASAADEDGQPAVATPASDAFNSRTITIPLAEAEPQVAEPASEPKGASFVEETPTVGEPTPAEAGAGTIRELAGETRAAPPAATESEDSTDTVTQVPQPELRTQGEPPTISVADDTPTVDETDTLEQQLGSQLNPPNDPAVVPGSADGAAAGFPEVPDVGEPDDSETAAVMTQTAERRTATIGDPVEAMAAASSPEAIEPGAGPAVPDIELPLEVSNVLFNHGSSYLSPGGVLMVDRAAAMLAELTGNYRVEIIGFTDTVGPVEFNVWLAERRVNRVIDALVRRGVPNDTLIAVPKGPFDLPVPTGPNVSEPINRAVVVQVSNPS